MPRPRDYSTRMKLMLLLLPGLLLLGCGTNTTTASRTDRNTPPSAPSPFSGELPDYWYRGEAELSVYDLEQARYGELRRGEAVLIQVTEPFLVGRQVKDEGQSTGTPESTTVLKTNLFRRFTTGIYDYSLMTSVFTPTDGSNYPRTLKVTTSSQDWCGQSYTQLNHRGGEAWGMQLRSYFEREGDREETLSADFLEDELFNRLRIGGGVPDGTYSVIPPTGYLLMTHQNYAAVEAVTATEALGDSLMRLTLTYTELPRRLEVHYDREAPYVIRRWTETYPSRGQELTTTASLRSQRTEPYWNLNGTVHEPLRVEMGLD